MPTKVLEVLIRGDASKLDAEFNKAVRKLDSFGRRADQIGRTLTRTVTLPIVAIGGAAIKASIDAETSLTRLAKTVDAPAAQLEMLGDRFAQLSENTIPRSASELTRLAALGGQLGIAVDNLDEFVEAVAAMDVAFDDLDAEQAAFGVAQFMNVMGTAQDQVERVGSVITDLGNNLATTEGRILEMAQRLAGAGRQIGLSEAQVLSFAGALASLGLQAQAGGSAFSRVFANMAAAVAEGGDRLANFAAVAGQSVTDFRQLFQDDAAGAIIAFVEGLGRLSDQGANVFGVLDQLELGELRVRDALLRAASGADKMREALQRGEQAWTQNTALAKEAERFYQRNEATLKRLANQAINLAADFGEALIPAFQAAMRAGQFLMARVLRPMVDAFASLPAPVQTLIVALTGVVAAMGPLGIAIGGVIRTFTALASVVRIVAGASALGGLAGLLAPGGLLLAGFAALAGLFLVLNSRTREFSAETQTLKRNLEELAGGFDDMGESARAAVTISLAGRIANVQTAIADVRAEIAEAERTTRARLALIAGGPVTAPLAALVGDATRVLREQLRNLEEQERSLFATQQQLSESFETVATRAEETTSPLINLGNQQVETVDRVAEALKRLDTELAAIGRKQAVLGLTFDATEARARAFEQALDALAPLVADVDAKLAGQDRTLRSVAEAYLAAAEQARQLVALQEMIREQPQLLWAPLMAFGAGPGIVLPFEGFEKDAEEAAATAQDAASVIASSFATAFAHASAAADSFVDAFDRMIQRIIAILLQSGIQELLARLVPNLGGAQAAGIGGAVAGFLGFAAAQFLPFQHGGPIAAGTLAVVGEAGPELFVPSTSGTIVSNDQLRRSGGRPVSITINNHLSALNANGLRDLETEMMPRMTEGLIKALEESSVIQRKFLT